MGDRTSVIAIAASATNNYEFAATVAVDETVLFATGPNSVQIIPDLRLLSGGNWDINKLKCGYQSIASGASLYGSKPSTIWFNKPG